MEVTPLRAARKLMNMTLNDVAQGVGLDTGSLSRIERGIQTPSPATAETLANFFGRLVTEEHILYPSRFQLKQGGETCQKS